MASNSTKESGFGLLKLQIAGMLKKRDVERIATALDFQPSTIDKLKKEDEPSLSLVNEMESRAIISKTDVSRLINTFQKLDLHRAAKHVEKCFSDMKVESDATEIGIFQHARRGFQKVTQAVGRRLGNETGQQTVYPPDEESSGEIGSPTYPFVLENSTENNKIQIRMIEYHEQILSDEAKIRVCHIGKRNSNKGEVKCVLLLGKSGDGKTKMLNSLVNKILGVKWDDPFRYKVQVDEEEALATSQAEGQTKWISAYYLHDNDIIIVDTPGFCDEQGEIRDNFITEQIYSFFCNTSNIITHVNVVAFVMKASDRRLNDLQRLVFELVLSLFGNDIEPHLCLLGTFSESRSEVLPIVDTANMADVKFGKTFDIDNISLYYSLHTSEQCITDEYEARRRALEDKLMNLKWECADISLSHFLSYLRNSSSVTIDKSAHVIERRRQLQEVLNGILEVIKSTVIRLDQLEQDKQAAKRHRLQLLEHIYFEYSVTQEIVTREKVVSDKALVCHKCQRTCENPCKSSFVMLSNAMKVLSVFRGCGVCESNCSVSLHEITDFIYKREETTFLKSSEQLLSENRASNEVINIDDQIEQKTEEAKNTLKRKVEDAKFYVCELQKSALRQNVKTLIEYLQEMIAEEQRHDTSGSNRRVLLLLELLNNEMRANRADWCGSEVS